MANEQNLKPFNTLTEKEQRKIQSAGGIASGKARKRKTILKDLLEIALLLPNEETGEQNDIAITSALIKKAIAGDTKAYEVIRDTIGQKVAEQQTITFDTSIDPKKLKEIKKKLVKL